MALSAGALRSVPWLLAAIVVLRSPALVFGVLNIDECEFAVIARTLRAGGLLYVDVADIKPPLAYLAFLPGAFGGDVVQWIFSVFWILATALLLRAAASRWTGSEEVGWAAAWCSLLAGLVEVPSTNAEVIMNLPTAAALLSFVIAEKGGRLRHDLIAGVLVGLASLVKHQAAVALCAMAIPSLVTWVRSDRHRSALGRLLARWALSCLGFVLPWLAAWTYFAILGHAPEFVDWSLARNFSYVGVAATSGWSRFLVSLLVCVLLATPLVWILSVREAIRPPEPIRLALALLLPLTWLAVGMGGRYYEHYFLQFVPPLALLAAPQAAALAARRSSLTRGARVAFTALALVPVLGYLAFTYGRGLAGRYPGQNPTARAVAQWLKDNTAPSDRLFVWGQYSPLYCLSGRLPGTRYVSTAVHMGNFDPEHLPADFDVTLHRSQRDVDLALRDLERRRPALIIDTAPADLHRWSLFPLARFPDLDRHIQERYRHIASPAGLSVYRLKGTE